MRGATCRRGRPLPGRRDFNPRTPCGVRRTVQDICDAIKKISIHAPHAGCDHRASTLEVKVCVISIHAPHAGCDMLLIQTIVHQQRISIHAPRMGCDLLLTPAGPSDRLFQSTHPMRGATADIKVKDQYEQFQSTHPMRGATRCGSWASASSTDFNPRTPCGVRRG